jgi:AcrR family transcriptional regulator
MSADPLENASGLPASHAAAWGLRERPSKGPKPGLSLERIIAAGLAVAATDGLAAVSMGRVAAELGAGAMSLYRYVGSKDELLELMVDAAYGPPPSLDHDGGWRDGLAGWATAEHAAMRRHPWALRVPISGPPALPNSVAWLEAGLDCLRDTGLTETEKLSVMLLLSGFVRNATLLAADIESAGTTDVMPGYARLLAHLTDAERFPALHRAIAGGGFDDEDDIDAEFVFGLERLLDGVAALVAARA